MAETSVFTGNQWTTASGSTWSVLIEPDFVNQVAELASHLALASQDARTQSEKLVERAQAAGSAESSSSATQSSQKEIVKDVVQLVGSNGLNQGAEARDVEGFVNLASSLVYSLFKDAEAEELLQQLAQGASKAGSSEAAAVTKARYSALSSLFNALPESASANTRASTLLALFKLAASKDDLSLLTTALLALPNWLSSEWGVSDSASQDALMSQFIEALESATDKIESAELVRKLLTSYANANTSSALREKLLFATLAHPTNLHDVDLESLPAVENQALNQLKEVFLSGGVKDLDSFFSSNGDLANKLDKEKIKEKLQFVVLADYCAPKVGQDITYDEVAEVLGLQMSDDEEERAMQVEIWVIATIRVKLLTARLHQPSSTISILQASPRRFGSAQWSLLQSRLESWKSSIANIQETVGRALGPSSSSSQNEGQRDGGNSGDRRPRFQQQPQSHRGGEQQQQQHQQTPADAQSVVNAAAEQQSVEVA